jgi:hypothetical protein
VVALHRPRYLSRAGPWLPLSRHVDLRPTTQRRESAGGDVEFDAGACWRLRRQAARNAGPMDEPEAETIAFWEVIRALMASGKYKTRDYPSVLSPGRIALPMVALRLAHIRPQFLMSRAPLTICSSTAAFVLGRLHAYAHGISVSPAGIDPFAMEAVVMRPASHSLQASSSASSAPSHAPMCSRWC